MFKTNLLRLKYFPDSYLFNLMTNSGISMSLKDFEEGRYGEGDKEYFKREWEKMKKKAEELGLI
jgi:hypothetical protein